MTEPLAEGQPEEQPEEQATVAAPEPEAVPEDDQPIRSAGPDPEDIHAAQKHNNEIARKHYRDNTPQSANR